MVDVAFVRHISVIEHGVCTFRGKGINNSFCIQTHNIYSIDENSDTKVVSSPLHHSLFFLLLLVISSHQSMYLALLTT